MAIFDRLKLTTYTRPTRIYPNAGIGRAEAVKRTGIEIWPVYPKNALGNVVSVGQICPAKSTHLLGLFDMVIGYPLRQALGKPLSKSGLGVRLYVSIFPRPACGTRRQWFCCGLYVSYLEG